MLLENGRSVAREGRVIESTARFVRMTTKNLAKLLPYITTCTRIPLEIRVTSTQNPIPATLVYTRNVRKPRTIYGSSFHFIVLRNFLLFTASPRDSTSRLRTPPFIFLPIETVYLAHLQIRQFDSAGQSSDLPRICRCAVWDKSI
jgi:hypothetical protein